MSSIERLALTVRDSLPDIRRVTALSGIATNIERCLNDVERDIQFERQKAHNAAVIERNRRLNGGRRVD